MRFTMKKTVCMLVLACAVCAGTFAQKTAEDYFKSGNEHFREGDYDKAIADFTEAIKLDPQYAEAYYYRGNAYFYKDEYAKAIADYETVLKIEPDNTLAKYGIELAKRKNTNAPKNTKESSRFIDMPLITLQVDNQLKESFYNTMLYLSENPGDNAQSIDFGLCLFGPQELSINGSYLMFKNINEWLSIPLFGAGAIGFKGYGLFAGSGIIIKNRFFMLGVMAGLYTGMFTYGTNSESWEHGTTTTKFDFGLFPVFDAAKYPFVNLFLKQIDGLVYSNEPEVKDIKIGTINYLLNISFKRFWRLSVLDVYIRNGTNNFMYGYDLSNYTIEIENWASSSDPFAKFVTKLGGNSFSISGDYNAKIYKTTTYGLRVGSDSFMVDLSYLMINDNLVTYDSIKNGYVDYQYPFGLNGFPTITFNFSIERDEVSSLGWFLRFSTINQIGMSFVPEIGMIGQGKYAAMFFTWTFPHIMSFSMRYMF